MNRLSIKALAAGIAFDLVATNLLLLPVVVILATRPEVQAALPAAQGAAVVAAWEQSWWAYPLGVLLGSLASIGGGWIAAGIAGRQARLHGALSALGCVALGIYGWVSGVGTVGPWVHIAFLVLAPGLGALGGLLRERRRVRHVSLATDSATQEPSSRLGGWPRALLIFDRLMIGVAFLTLLAFLGVATLVEETVPYQTLGAWILAGYALMVMLAYYGASRALQSGHPRYRRFHVGAVVLTTFPTLLLL